MSASVVSEDIEDEQESLILDIDMIQNHGVGAADIAKLKTAGYWTVAVSSHYILECLRCCLRLMTVCPRCHQEDSEQDQGFQ